MEWDWRDGEMKWMSGGFGGCREGNVSRCLLRSPIHKERGEDTDTTVLREPPHGAIHIPEP